MYKPAMEYSKSIIRAPVPSSQIARCQNDVIFVAMVTHVKDLQMQSKEVWAPPQKGPRKIFWMDFRRVMVKYRFVKTIDLIGGLNMS